MFEFKEKNILITGSSQGIGKEMAKAFARCGANIMIHGLEKEQVDDTACEIHDAFDVHVGKSYVNLSETGACKQLYLECKQQIGDIDVFVSNAAIQYERPWSDATRDEFISEMAVNVWPLIELSQLVIPSMKASGYGRIIAVGSVQQYKPNSYTMTYASGKSAVDNLVRGMALELGSDGITVNCISPGVVETPRLKQYLATKPEKESSILTGLIPMKRFADPSECSGTVLLLASEEGAYINGANIAIDGGMRL